MARVGVYAISETARLEVAEALQPLESPVSGRIVAVEAVLGDRVEAGDALFQIEAEVQRLQLERQRREGASSAAQQSAVDEELRVKARALDQQLDAARAALAEARARQSESDEQARFATDKEKRMEDLYARGLISEVERLQAQTEMRQSLAAGETQRLAVVRFEAELLARENAGRAELAELERERARLAGDVDTSETSVERLEHELGQRIVRAPVTGKIATLAPAPGRRRRVGRGAPGERSFPTATSKSWRSSILPPRSGGSVPASWVGCASRASPGHTTEASRGASRASPPSPALDASASRWS